MKSLTIAFAGALLLSCSSNDAGVVSQDDADLRVPEQSAVFVIEFSGASPANAIVNTGATVTFRNQDEVPHHILGAMAGASPFYDSGPDGFFRMTSVDVLVDESGVIEFWCDLHNDGFRVQVTVVN